MRIAAVLFAGILVATLSPRRAESDIELTTLGDGALLGSDHEAQIASVADLDAFWDGADTSAEAGPDGSFFVAGPQGIYLVDRDGGVSPFLHLVDESIVMISDENGGLYVARPERDSVLHVAADGSQRVVIDAAGDGRGASLDSPNALVLDAAGYLYVSGASSRNVFLVAPTGEILLLLDAAGDGAGNSLDSPHALAVDAADNLYVADWGGAEPSECAVPGASNLFRISLTGRVDTVAQELFDEDSHAGEPVCWLGVGVDESGSVDLVGWRRESGRGWILRVGADGSRKSLLETCSNGRGGRFLLGGHFAFDRIEYDDRGSLYVTTLTSIDWRYVFKIDPSQMPATRGQRVYYDRGDGGAPAVTGDGEVYLASGRNAGEVKLLRLRPTDPVLPAGVGERIHYLEGAPPQRMHDGSTLMARGNLVSDEGVSCDRGFWLSAAGIEVIDAKLPRSSRRGPDEPWVAALPEKRKAVYNEHLDEALWGARAMLLDGGEPRPLESLSPDHTSRAMDVSLDGSTIVGGVNFVAQGSWWHLPEELAAISPDDFDNGYLWRDGEVTPLRDLPGIPDHYWKVVGERVSGDGSVIIGRVYSYGLPDEWGDETGQPNSDWSYFRWESGSFTLLEPPSGWWLHELHELGGGNSREEEAYRVEALSDDGSVAVGWAQGTIIPQPGGYSWELPARVAVRWTADGAIHRLPPILVYDDGSLLSYCSATAVSGDGSLVVGECGAGGSPWFLWDAQNGTRDLKELVDADRGGDLPALDIIQDVSALSSDARALVATCRWLDGTRELCQITLPPACSDGRDNDGDGLVDHPADPACSSPEDAGEVERGDVALDFDPWRDPNVLTGRKERFAAMAILGSASVDVDAIEGASLTLAGGVRAPIAPLSHRLVRWLSTGDWNTDGYADLLVLFRAPDLGLERGYNEVCLQGEIEGESFVACDGVELRTPRPMSRWRRASSFRRDGRMERRRGGWGRATR